VSNIKEVKARDGNCDSVVTETIKLAAKPPTTHRRAHTIEMLARCWK